MATTAGELKAALADIDDGAPLLILFDSRAGVSDKISIINNPEPDDVCDWAEPGTIYLDISADQ